MAATVYTNDLISGHEVEHARETLLFILHTIKLFRKHWKSAQLFLAKLLHNLKDCDIDLNATAADAIPLRCWVQIGEDFDALGPLFATDTLLDTQVSKQQPTGRFLPAASEPDSTSAP